MKSSEGCEVKVPGSMAIIFFLATIYPLLTGKMPGFGNFVAFSGLCLFGPLITFLLAWAMKQERSIALPPRGLPVLLTAVCLIYAAMFLGVSHGVIPALVLAVTGTVSAWALFWKKSEGLEMRRPASLALKGLCVIVLATSVLSSQQYEAFGGSFYRRTGLLAFACCVIIFLGTVRFVQDPQGLDRAMKGLLACCILVSALCWWQFFDDSKGGYPQFPQITVGARPSGTFGNRNWLGTYLCLMLPLAASSLMQATRPRLVAGWAAVAGLVFGAVLVCQTRGAWLAIALWAIWAAYTRRTQWRRLATLAAVFILVSAILLPSRNGEIMGRMQKLHQDFSDAAEGSPAAGAGRFEIWFSGIHRLPQHCLLGSGLDCYEAEGVLSPADKAHSLYLEYAITIGLPGLACYLAFLIFTLGGSSGSLDKWEWGFCGVLIAYLAQGIFIHDTIRSWPIVWLIAGLAVANRRIQQRDPAQTARRPGAARERL